MLWTQPHLFVLTIKRVYKWSVFTNPVLRDAQLCADRFRCVEHPCNFTLTKRQVMASCQIRMIAGCAFAGNAGNVSTSPQVSDPEMHHSTSATHVPWCMPESLTSGFLWSQWQGKGSRHSRCMRNPQFYVSGKRPITWNNDDRNKWPQRFGSVAEVNNQVMKKCQPRVNPRYIPIKSQYSAYEGEILVIFCEIKWSMICIYRCSAVFNIRLCWPCYIETILNINWWLQISWTEIKM